MSSSATARTSTTASSPSSASSPPPENAERPIEIVACGALAGHIREIAARRGWPVTVRPLPAPPREPPPRRGWPVTVRPLPAALHNRPQQIKSHAERMLATPGTQGARTLLGYADCGTYGALDKLAAAGASRLPGLHCYDLYAGAAQVEQLFAEEPGTYPLTAYSNKTFPP